MISTKKWLLSPRFLSLRTFCDSGFFTSYYIPYFNPYLLSETELVDQIDSISYQMKLYPASALSGYYFQYPVLKKFFPGFPVLTWTYNSNISLVTNMFNLHLKMTTRLKSFYTHYNSTLVNFLLLLRKQKIEL